MRNAVVALVVTLLSATLVHAEEFSGLIRKLDVEKGELVVSPMPNVLATAKEAGKPREYSVSKETKVVDASDKEIEKGIADERVKVGAKVKVFYKMTEDGKIVVEKIQLTEAK
jgi:hypothetical protein